MQNSNIENEFSNENLLADLKRVANQLASTRLTIAMYDEHGAYAPRTVAYHFGTWNAAVEAAGLNPTHQSGTTINKRANRRNLLRNNKSQ
jgi:hypothetical protein